MGNCDDRMRMKTIVSLHHIRRTPSLEERIARKSEKLAPFFGKKQDIRLHWHCGAKEGGYGVELDLSAFHSSFHAKAQSPQLYKAIDEVLEKIERQLKKRREKKSSSRKESRPYKYKAA